MGLMKTKFNTFLNEDAKFSVKFADEVKTIMRDAETRVADLLKSKIKDRIISFHTNSFYDSNFKISSSTSHQAILTVNDVIYKPELGGQYNTAFFVKSMDRIRPVWSKTNPRDQVGLKVYEPYCDINPSGKIFYIDDFIKWFQTHAFQNEILFYGDKDADRLRLFRLGDVKPVKGIPTNIEIKLDAAHQCDMLRITLDDDPKQKYYIDYFKPVKVLKDVDQFDPYGEEVWD